MHHGPIDFRKHDSEIAVGPVDQKLENEKKASKLGFLMTNRLIIVS